MAWSDVWYMTINYDNPAEHPNVQMATIQVKGEIKKPNGSQTFQYAMHMKNTANKAVEGTHPQIAPEMCRCATIKIKVNRCKPYIMIDTGSTGNFVKLCICKGHWDESIPIGATAHITIRLHRQLIKNHSWW